MQDITRIEPARTRFAKRLRVVRRMIGAHAVSIRALRAGLGMIGATHPVSGTKLMVAAFLPFCCASWSEDEKLGRILSHFHVVAHLPGPFTPAPAPRELLTLPMVAPGLRLQVDEPEWMIYDGLLTLSLWDGIDRIFSLTLTLSDEGTGLTAYIGGLQGRAGDAMRDRYRELTQCAHGMRPRDLMIECARVVLAALGVRRILAVTQHARHHFDPYFGSAPTVPWGFDYDEAWLDRGGMRVSGDWMELPLAPALRSEAEIPAKKRTLYRKRYAMLAEVQAAIGAALARTQADPALPHLISSLPEGTGGAEGRLRATSQPLKNKGFFQDARYGW